MSDSNKIKQQKLILESCKDTSVYFIDEYKGSHETIGDDGELVDLYLLVISCFEPITEEGSILTCSCGWPEDAGFFDFSSQITDNEIIWNINEGEDYIKFDKNQYSNEIKACIEKLIEICKKGPENYTNDYFYNPLDLDTLNTYNKVFTDESMNKGREKPRHKIIIKPGDKSIYTKETGKKVFIQKRDLKFSDTDIFGQPLLTWLNADDIKRWYNKLNDKNTDWNEWNAQGLEIAKDIKSRISDAFDVWYQYQNTTNDKLVHIENEE